MSSESSGARTLQGLLLPPAACRGSGSGQAMADRHSAAQSASRLGGRAGKRVRGDRGDNPDQGLRPQCPRRAKPRGASSRRRVNRPSADQGLLEGQKPRSRGRPGRLTASAVGKPGGENGTWVHPGRNDPETFREEKAPKGESHERRRRETKPARARREETARRVAKP
jgi:hypothetical protein